MVNAKTAPHFVATRSDPGSFPDDTRTHSRDWTSFCPLALATLFYSQTALGFSFRENTDDLRESQHVALVEAIIGKRKTIDPSALTTADRVDSRCPVRRADAKPADAGDERDSSSRSR